MNSDDSPSTPPVPSTDPALEARIVAVVLGEASALETTEIDRLCAEQPELAEFRRRIAEIHGLVAEAVRPAPAELRLAPERRAKLLATLASAPVDHDEAQPVATVFPSSRRWPDWALPAAACLALAGLLAAIVIPTVGTIRGFSGSFGVASRPAPVDLGFSQRALQNEVTESTVTRAPKSPAAPELSGALRDDQAVVSFRVGSVVNAPSAPVAAPAPSADALTVVSAGGLQISASQSQPNAALEKRLLDSRQKDTGYLNRDESADLPALAGEVRRRPSLRKQKAADIVGATEDSPVFFADSDKNQPVTSVDGSLSFGGGISVNAQPQSSSDGSPVLFGSGEPQAQPRIDASSELAASSRFALNGSNSYTGATALEESAAQDAKGQFQVPVIVDRETDALPSPAALAYAEFGKKSGAKEESKLGISNKALALRGGATSASQDKDGSDAAKPAPRPAPDLSLRREVASADQPVSTFSLHVSDASFRLARAALARGEFPDPAAIRPEEFYNAFDYGDPAPQAGEPVAARIEQAAHPLLQQRNLLRVALRVPAAGRGAGQPLRLTLLLDTSGSMEREDRANTVRRALEQLASLLGPADRVTLVGFARTPRLLADRLPGDQAASLARIAADTPPEGGTNLDAALSLATDLALRQFDPAAQNRVVLLTDGAANLGDADPAALSVRIVQLRQKGVAFDACGVGANGLDDGVLEALTRQGDGRYLLLDNAEEAGPAFARQLAGAFRPAAQNVKVQVRFNPSRVPRYRLVGFEQHRLREEDFRNDKVDAAELAAAEAAVALYQIEVDPQGTGELGEVFVRFRETATGRMVERSWPLPYDAAAPAFDHASPSLQLAGASALLAEKLQGGDTGASIRLSDLDSVAAALRARAGLLDQPRVAEFLDMLAQARRLSPE